MFMHIYNTGSNSYLPTFYNVCNTINNGVKIKTKLQIWGKWLNKIVL